MRIGDILLCSGNGFLSRRIIGYNKVVLRMKGPAAELSHVAMIGPNANQVFEATTLNSWCGKKGVQANPFEAWIKNYDGNVWIREGFNHITSLQYGRMYEKMNALIGTPYENGIPGAMELFLAGFKIPWLSDNIAQNLRTHTALHCSEADGEVLKDASILSLWVRTNKIPPCLWWSFIDEINAYYAAPKQIK